MSLFSFFKRKPQRLRPRLSGEAVQALLLVALRPKAVQPGVFQPNIEKRILACPTREEFEAVAQNAFRKWEANRWECEDQLRRAIDAAQQKAAQEGISWACGGLRADPPPSAPAAVRMSERHKYAWVFLDTPKGRELAIFDTTANDWARLQDLTGVEYCNTN
ncbi:MAG: hypothetical protein R3F13_13260 [Prosthecobacter sp.]